MNKGTLLLFFLLSTIYGFTQQTFIKEIGYGISEGPKIVSTPDDGVLMMSLKSSGSRRAALLSKFDKCGNVVWAWDALFVLCIRNVYERDDYCCSSN